MAHARVSAATLQLQELNGQRVVSSTGLDYTQYAALQVGVFMGWWSSPPVPIFRPDFLSAAVKVHLLPEQFGFVSCLHR